MNLSATMLGMRESFVDKRCKISLHLGTKDKKPTLTSRDFPIFRLEPNIARSMIQ